MLRVVSASDGGQNPLVLGFVVGCEIGFWVVLTAGLSARYVLRRPRLGAILLYCVPLVDLVLIVVSIIDLRTGGTAGMMHSLAAVYLGVSVAFGPELVRRTDARFAHRFDAAPALAPPPRHGPEKVSHEWRMWTRCVVALALSSALTSVMYLLADSGANALELWNFELQLAIVTVVWFLVGPLRVTVFFPRAPARKDRRQ